MDLAVSCGVCGELLLGEGVFSSDIEESVTGVRFDHIAPLQVA